MSARIALRGGLQLLTPAPSAPPGSLRACLNFESSSRDGYTRLTGVEKFDGSPGPGIQRFWRLRYTTGGNFSPGDEVYFDVAQPGYVIYSGTEGAETILYTVWGEDADAPSLPDTLTCTATSATATITTREVVFIPEGLQEDLDDALAAIDTRLRALIGQPTPAQEGSDTIGLFWFRNSLYAVRDLPRVSFEGGYYTDESEGAYVTIDGENYRILDVDITGDNAGSITYVPWDGTESPAIPIGTPVIATLPISGSLSGGFVGVPYSDGFSVSGGVPPYAWSLASEGTADDETPPSDLADIVMLSRVTNAGLFRATSAGWVRQELGREMAFRSGTTSLANFPRTTLVSSLTPKSTGWVFPDSAEIDGVAAANVLSDNGVTDAMGTANGSTLVAQFTPQDLIPAGAEIVGIEVRVDRSSAAGGVAQDLAVQLLDLGVGSENKAKQGDWPAVAATVTYGSDSDLWGVGGNVMASITASAGLKVLVSAKRANPANPLNAAIDYVSINVHYLQRGIPIYIWNGTTDVEATLFQIQVLTGDTTTGDAAGYLAIEADVNAEKVRLVTEGDAVRTAAAGGGDLLCTVASRDRPVFFAGQVEIDNNRSRYQFKKLNFFGQDSFSAIYGVCGASPSFQYDGDRLVYLRTALPPSKDIPRHIAKHGSSLGLGFWEGAVVFSAVGDPFEQRGANGAWSFETGDRVYGLATLSGDALGILGEESTQAIRGITQDAAYGSVISSRRGAIEYTEADMGRVILADSFGLFAADSAESFGPAERNYLSLPVLEYLEERLQATLNSDQALIRPIAAMAVRGKNQYRLYFRDGSILTLAVKAQIEFTTQRYYEPGTGDFPQDTPWPVRALAAGIDASGRERLFCSYVGGVKDGYVYEMDRGRTFDGDPIPHYIELNPLTMGNGAQETKLDRGLLWGTATGAAPLEFSRAANYNPVDATKFLAVTLGKTAAAASAKPIPAKMTLDFPIDAYEVSLRFAGETDSVGEFTLQLLQLFPSDRGTTRGTRGE